MSSKQDCVADQGQSLSSTSPIERPQQTYRYDGVLWLFGMLFLGILLSLIFGIGDARGWDAQSGYTHYLTNNSMERFMSDPFEPEDGVYKRSDKDASSRWYYWKAKPEEVTALTKLLPWACYTVHLLSVWLVLYLQHKAKSFPDESNKYAVKYTGSPDKYNIIQFCLNMFFCMLHLVNTHTTYDALAGDITEATAQCAFIAVIVLASIIEFKDRGIVFGYPTPEQLKEKQDSVWLTPVYLTRKYHGYFVYWATVTTFWYHPMENTLGHAFGFAQVWFMMMQGSLVFTKVHLNKYWRVLMETWVIIHSGVVAVQVTPVDPTSDKQSLWPMFVFGFGTIAILTQIYGLPFWKNMPSWARAIPSAIYVVTLVIVFNFVLDKEGRKFTRIQEIIRIPGIVYLALIFTWLIIVLFAKIRRVHEARKTENSDGDAGAASKLSTIKEVLLICSVMAIYGVCIFLMWIVEYVDWKTSNLNLLFVLTFACLFLGPIVGAFIFTQIIPMKKNHSTVSPNSVEPDSKL